MPINRQQLLDNRPEGEATASNFKLVSSETRALNDNDVLVRHHFLSLDPYMRGRMNDSKSYAVPQPLGQVMQGGAAGEVIESRDPKYAVGDKVVGFGGWQEYSVVDASAPGALKKVDTTHILSSCLTPACLAARIHLSTSERICDSISAGGVPAATQALAWHW